MASSSSPLSSKKKQITLICSDGESFEVEMDVAIQSETVKHLIEGVRYDGRIHLDDVTGTILRKVLGYLEKHIEPGATGDKESDKETLRAWDTEFAKLDGPTIVDLILAANYLNIKSLVELTYQAMADMIKNKTPEEIRATFNIVNDFTHEEEAEIHREIP